MGRVSAYEPLVLAGYVPPGKLGLNGRMHPIARARLGEVGAWHVRTGIRGLGWTFHHDRKRRLIITMHRANLLDEDAKYAVCKYILDQLVKECALKDDSPQWLELEVRQEKCKRAEQRTVIQLEDLVEVGAA